MTSHLLELDNDLQNITFDFEFGLISSGGSNEEYIHHDHNEQDNDDNNDEKDHQKYNNNPPTGSTKEEIEEWLLEKRQYIAKASKNAREKKRNEISQLQNENRKLKEERLLFLTKIDELKTKIQEIREADGEVDVYIENELLKNQLKEHKSFVGALMKVAGGAPSIESDRLRLYRQGVDFAVVSLMSILDKSVKQLNQQQENSTKDSWNFVEISPDMQQFLPGSKISCWYRFFKEPSSQESFGKRLIVRMDHEIPNVKAQDAVNLYWSIWTNPELLRKFMDPLQTDTVYHETLINEQEASLDGSKEQAITTTYIRERYPTPHINQDFIFVSSKRIQNIPAKTLFLPLNQVFNNNKNSLSTTTTTTTIPNTKRMKLSSPTSSKKEKNSNVDNDNNNNPLSSTTKNTESLRRELCHVLVRSSTKHKPANSTIDSSSLVSNEQQRDMIGRQASMYLESCIGVDLEQGCRFIVVISTPENFKIGDIDVFKDLVTEQGQFTEAFVTHIRTFVHLLHSGVSVVPLA